MTSYALKIFERLHAIPETGFKEFETSKLIAEELKSFGIEVHEGVAGTGVIAKISSGVKGPVLAVRADMDALEHEIDGKRVNIHSCGHDANSAMALAAAKAIAAKGIATGKAVFVFQPAEEILGGAIGISQSGHIDDVDEIVGIHLRPIQEAKLGEATPALKHGASNTMDVTIHGLSSHGARPHLGVNAIEAAILAINAVNTVKVDPKIPHSAKVTQFNSFGTSTNIIPDRARFVLDLRAQTNEVMGQLIQRLKSAIEASVSALVATAEINVGVGVLAASYSDETVDLAKSAIEDVLGGSIDSIVTPGGDDFHVYANELNVKTAFVGLGANLVPGLHHPEMTFDTKALDHGTEILKQIVFKRLG